MGREVAHGVGWGVLTISLKKTSFGGVGVLTGVGVASGVGTGVGVVVLHADRKSVKPTAIHAT